MPDKEQHRHFITVGERLWSSRASHWCGFALELQRSNHIGALHGLRLADMLLEVCTGGRSDIQIGNGVGARRATFHEGDFNLLPSGTDPRAIRWTGAREVLLVHLDADMLARLTLSEPDLHRESFVARFAVRDPVVHRLALCMHDEAMAGCPAGPSYATSLSRALTEHLRARYAERDESRATGAVLSRSVRNRIDSYVAGNLQRPITLDDLAAVVGLSPHYFTHLFKSTYGTTPHRHVTNMRIDAAKKLLENDAETISDVAISLGFADQSHFTSVFHRVTGHTPLQFRHRA